MEEPTMKGDSLHARRELRGLDEEDPQNAPPS
jgi:hypothetical protein